MTEVTWYCCEHSAHSGWMELEALDEGGDCQIPLLGEKTATEAQLFRLLSCAVTGCERSGEKCCVIYVGQTHKKSIRRWEVKEGKDDRAY